MTIIQLAIIMYFVFSIPMSSLFLVVTMDYLVGLTFVPDDEVSTIRVVLATLVCLVGCLWSGVTLLGCASLALIVKLFF